MLVLHAVLHRLLRSSGSMGSKKGKSIKYLLALRSTLWEGVNRAKKNNFLGEGCYRDWGYKEFFPPKSIQKCSVPRNEIHEEPLEKRPCGNIFRICLLWSPGNTNATSLHAEHWSVLSIVFIYWIFFKPPPQLSSWVVSTHFNNASMLIIPTNHPTSLLRNKHLKAPGLLNCFPRPLRTTAPGGSSTVGKNHWSPMNFRSPALRSVFSTRFPVMAKATCMPRGVTEGPHLFGGFEHIWRTEKNRSQTKFKYDEYWLIDWLIDWLIVCLFVCLFDWWLMT